MGAEVIHPGFLPLLSVALLGGVLALDGVAAVQSMVSRPLVAGWLAGWILGDPVTGIEIGVLLELQLLVAVPSGGGLVPEGGTATLVAVAAATELSGTASGAGALAWGVALGLIWGQVAGQTQIWMRRANEGITADRATTPLTASSLRQAQRRGLGLDFLRGTLVTGLGVLLARGALPYLTGGWPLQMPQTFALLLAGSWVSVGIVLRGAAPGRRGTALFGAGLLAGAIWVGVSG